MSDANALLRSRHAVWLTHGGAIVMTSALFALLLTLPFKYAFIPAVLLTHRIGVMMHEYIHGIPFRRYANCLRVLAFFDGLMLMFGLLELFRATHLSHHRWLNSAGDSAHDNQHVKTESARFTVCTPTRTRAGSRSAPRSPARGSSSGL